MKSNSNNSKFINSKLAETGLFKNPKREIASAQNSTWRISPEPFFIDQTTYDELENLGKTLYSFYRAVNRLYELSVRGKEPAWIVSYLDAGKPEQVIEYGRMRRLRQDLPFIIRPDVILTNDGFIVSELDSVPGGFGLLGALSEHYSALGFDLIGGKDGIIQGFLDAITNVTTVSNPTLAIVVSEESQDYLGEMEYLAGALTEKNISAFTIAPEDVIFQEDGLYLEQNNNLVKIDVIYRFFELFDLKNIPKMDLILYAIRKQLAVITPPIKSYLEEKMLFALLHHPSLRSYWLSELGENDFELLSKLFPYTWLMDPRELPPHGIIPKLTVANQAVNDWNQLKQATKRERELVVKVSGFSNQAWGSRGVNIGHDLSGQKWADAIDNALASFPENPYILQEFHKGKQVTVNYYDFDEEKTKTMNGRVRLCPYYMIANEQVTLTGILATICPLDKKLIHGMVDAVMIPTAIRSE